MGSCVQTVSGEGHPRGTESDCRGAKRSGHLLIGRQDLSNGRSKAAEAGKSCSIRALGSTSLGAKGKSRESYRRR